MRRLLGILMLAGSLHAQALTLRVCTLDQPFHPLTMPDGSGSAQQLMRQASKGAGVAFVNVFAPRLRCAEMMKAGEVDALLSAYLPERRAAGAFPMAGNRPNEALRLGAVRFMLYQVRGGTVTWNGDVLGGLGKAPIGVLAGLAVTEKIRSTGAVADEGARTVAQNFEKLAAGRLSAVVALESEGQRLLDQHFKDRIVALDKAFDVTPVYLHVNLDYYARHQGAVELLWKETKKARESAAFQQYLKHM